MHSSRTPQTSNGSPVLRVPGGKAQLPAPFVAKQFDFSKVQGISTRTLEVHKSLYETYVKEANGLLTLLYDRRPDTNAQPLQQIEYDGLVRRFAFERNGVTLHELFFESLRGGSNNPSDDSRLGAALSKSFGSFDDWKRNVEQFAKTRGIGWVLTLQSEDGSLANVWIDDHTDGFLANSRVIAAFDLWEHAYLLDFKPSERPKYFQILFENIDWDVIDSRCQ